jgi:drug/metabolite transporter (DMT)-like permease
MENLDVLLKYLPLLIPILVLQLILMVVALVDLSRREKTRGPKWVWALVIVLGELLGPILYFIIGRKE